MAHHHHPEDPSQYVFPPRCLSVMVTDIILSELTGSPFMEHLGL